MSNESTEVMEGTATYETVQVGSDWNGEGKRQRPNSEFDEELISQNPSISSPLGPYDTLLLRRSSLYTDCPERADRFLPPLIDEKSQLIVLFPYLCFRIRRQHYDTGRCVGGKKI